MIQMTEKAVEEVKRLQSKENDPTQTYLRVKVVGGGCSGMSYKLGFDTQEPSEKDKVLEKSGVQMVVDSKSYLFLSGTELDFTDGLNGKGFVFRNPNAKRTCGCGESFSV